VFNLGTQRVELHGMSSVQLQGHGFRTLFLFAGDGPAVSVAGSTDVILERFAVAALFGRELPSLALGIASSQLVRVERCALLQVGGRDRGAPAVGLAGVLVQVALHDNVIFGRDGIRAITADPAGDQQPGTTIGPRPRSILLTFGLSISENLVFGARHAIDLGARSIHLGDNRVDDNQLVGGAVAAFLAQGLVPVAAVLPSRLEVRGNVVTAAGDGIAVGTHQTRVVDNDVGIAGTRGEDDVVRRHGIVLLPGVIQAPIEGCQVIGNRVTGMSGDGIRIAAPVGSAMIKQNVLRALGGGIVMADGSEAVALTIENNQLFDVGAGNVRGELVAGIRAQRTDQLEIASNTIRGFAEAAVQTQLRAAIEVQASASIRVVGNDLQRIGPAESAAGTTVGILVAGSFEAIGLHDNSIRRAQPVRDPAGLRWLGIVVDGGAGRRIATDANPALGTIFLDPARFVSLDDDRLAHLDELTIVVLPAGLQSVGVRGNVVAGVGEESMIFVRGRATATLSENRVEAAISAGSQRPTVLVAGREVIASSNSVVRVPRNPDLVAVQLDVSLERMTVLGNVVQGGRVVTGPQDLGDPWRPLNVIL
jgi:hypothetical protein